MGGVWQGRLPANVGAAIRAGSLVREVAGF